MVTAAASAAPAEPEIDFGEFELDLSDIELDLDMDDLAAAIRGTFARRDTIVPAACPVGLSEEFSTDPAKMTQWRAYSGGTALEGRPLAEVTAEIWAWLEPACRAEA